MKARFRFPAAVAFAVVLGGVAGLRLDREGASASPPPAPRARHERGRYGPLRSLHAAVGDLRLGGGTGLAGDVAPALALAWRRLGILLGGPVTTPPVRLFSSRRARPDLEGVCVTLEWVFATVPDPEAEPDLVPRAGPVRGTVFSLRRTERLGPDGPRLLEAGLELHADAGTGVADAPALARLDPSPARSRLSALGAGARLGLHWSEKSGGVAYRVHVAADGTRREETGPLAERLAAALREAVARVPTAGAP